MYILNYDTKKIKKFSNLELENFLNRVVKNKFIFAKDKIKAKKLIKHLIKD